MSDALIPLRHAYDVEPLGAPLAPGDAGHAEQEALRQLRMVLEDWPVPAPSPHATAAVESRAAVVTAVLTQTDAAVARAVASRPQPRPSADVLAAVLARAAEPTLSASDALSVASPVEAALLDQSAQALDRLPRLRPDASVIAAIEARAADAAASLAPVRALYLDGPVTESTEAAVLAQSRTAIERSLAARPQPRPSADAVAVVLARAAEASGLEPEPVLEVPVVEAAVFAQSLRALDRLPRPRPSAATLDAVRLAAVTAVTAPLREDRPATSPDRAPVRPTHRRTPVGVWASVGTALVAALVLLVVLPFGGAPEAEPVAVAALADVTDAETPQPVAPSNEAPAEPLVEESPVAQSAPSALSTAATLPGVAPAAQRAIREASTPSPSPPTAAPQVASAQPTTRPTPSAARPTPSWDTPDDVRALSLRLQELDEADALAWDDAPAETFGVPRAPSAGSAPGLQSVRAGTPARARFRSDSSSTQR